jgi:hypothetical protein
MMEQDLQHHNNANHNQMCFDKPKLCVFTVQIALIFITVVTSLVNLSINNGNQNMWMIFLTSCLGYSLPNPKLKMYPVNGNGNDKKSINTSSF